MTPVAAARSSVPPPFGRGPVRRYPVGGVATLDLVGDGGTGPSGWRGYAAGVGVVAVVTTAALVLFDHEHTADAVMLYLLGVVLASLRLGPGPSLVTALLSVAVFDFVFIPPFLGFVMTDLRHFVTFVVMLTVSVVITRLTQRVRDQAGAAERARLASEQERLRNALLSSVSHDLRTPLGAIEGAASTLRDLGDSLDDATRREMVETIHEEAQRLGRRVANLLDMTRLEAGRVALNLEWQPLEEVVGSTLAQTEELLAGRVVRTDLPETLPAVRIDAVLLGQVLENLLENAVKYSPPGSPVRIAASVEDRGVRVVVEDEGTGVAPGHEHAIFEKFHRVSSDGGEAGVGLGLAICRAIVQAHGGRIWCESRTPGTAFVFTIPLDGQAPAPEVPA